MRYYQLQDKDMQKLITILQDKGTNNLANPHTKHHPINYHYNFKIKNNKIISNSPVDIHKKVRCKEINREIEDQNLSEKRKMIKVRNTQDYIVTS